VRVAPTIGAAFNSAPQTLNIIESGLVDYGRVRVFDNRPFAFIYIMAFLVFEMLTGLEVYRMSRLLSTPILISHSKITIQEMQSPFSFLLAIFV
jgi:hypothetical protein